MSYTHFTLEERKYLQQPLAGGYLIILGDKGIAQNVEFCAGAQLMRSREG